MAQLTCSACGAPLPDGAMFCGECGRSVAPAALAPAVLPPLSPDPRVPPRSNTSAASPARLIPPLIGTEPPLIDPAVLATQNPYATGDLSSLQDATVSLPALPGSDRPLVESAGDTADAPDAPDAPDAATEARAPSHEHPVCEACGAAMGAHDIFCGECGNVSGRVSRAFSGAGETAAVSWSEPSERVDDSGASRERDDVEGTRIVPPKPSGDRFILQFSTGESVTAYGSGLVGRNPVPEPGEYFDQLVRVIDPTRSVSKTHLEFGQDSGSLWVRDRFSGNGSILREPGVAPRRCDPGKRYLVARGTRVDLGEQFVIVS